MILTEVFLNYWWLIFLVVSSPYLYYYFVKYKNKKTVKPEKKTDPTLVQSEEQIHLGISIRNEDIKIYKKRIENLIILLDETKDKVSVNAVEAILIVELFSETVLVNEQGELVIDVKTAKDFSKTIYDDPMKFIAYIKSIENKIDIENPENKVEFGDVLYMMRNAKKFGLYINDDDSDVVYKIKSAIHESNYKDVVIKIVQDVSVEHETYSNTSIILNNLHKKEEIENSEEDSLDDNIKSAEKTEDGKVRLTMKDGKVFTKDDFIIYQVETPEEENTSHKSNQKNKNTPSLLVAENKNSEAVQEYISRFGKLDAHEEANKHNLIFKDRCLRFYDEKIFAYSDFAAEDFHTESFFKEDEKFYHFFVSALFNKVFAVRGEQPYIFIGNTVLKNGNTIRFITLDAYYFIALIYSSIKRKNRESFYNFIFKNKKIKEDNLNIFLENINEEFGFFHPTKDCFVFDIVYISLKKTISTKMINIKIEKLEELLSLNEEIRNSYSELKNTFQDEIQVRAYGEAALRFKSADITHTHDTFFRTPIEERIF